MVEFQGTPLDPPKVRRFAEGSCQQACGVRHVRLCCEILNGIPAVKWPRFPVKSDRNGAKPKMREVSRRAKPGRPTFLASNWAIFPKPFGPFDHGVLFLTWKYTHWYVSDTNRRRAVADLCCFIPCLDQMLRPCNGLGNHRPSLSATKRGGPWPGRP